MRNRRRVAERSWRWSNSYFWKDDRVSVRDRGANKCVARSKGLKTSANKILFLTRWWYIYVTIIGLASCSFFSSQYVIFNGMSLSCCPRLAQKYGRGFFIVSRLLLFFLASSSPCSRSDIGVTASGLKMQRYSYISLFLFRSLNRTNSTVR